MLCYYREIMTIPLLNKFNQTFSPFRRSAFDAGALILRVSAAGVMLTHGWGKFMQFFSNEPLQFLDPLGIGVTASLALASFAELFCAAALVIGLLTRPAALVLAINMAVALYATASQAWPKQELALLYLAMYLAVLLIGPGRWSADRLLCGKLTGCTQSGSCGCDKS